MAYEESGSSVWNDYKKTTPQAKVTNSLPANSNITDDRVKLKYATNDNSSHRNNKVKITEGPVREKFSGIETVDLITNSLPMNLDLQSRTNKRHFDDIIQQDMNKDADDEQTIANNLLRIETQQEKLLEELMGYVNPQP